MPQALARLRDEDERLGGDAEAALNSLTWDGGLETITQYGLQRFLWYELPRKWMTDLEDKGHLAMSLGRLLDLVGLARYAAICRSPETGAVLAAYERGDREGFAAFRRAEDRSGLQPPDLPELTWGPVMGMQEAGAFWSTAAAQELAVASGELRPGNRGWRAAQQAIAQRHLTAARPELDGRTWLEVVLAERVEEWAHSRGQARRTLVEPLLARLRAGPVAVPADAAEAVAPLRWLLGRAGEGIALTQKGNLARAVVIEAVERFRLAAAAEPAARGGRRLRAVGAARSRPGPGREGDAPGRAGRAGSRGGGRRGLARPGHRSASGPRGRAAPARRAAAVAGRAGPVPGGRRLGARMVALTGVGRAAALEALRARATGPRPDPFRG